MAHLVLGWELGNGMGHIMPLRMMAEVLLQRGHKLSFVVRDVSAAQRALQGLPVSWVQAPIVIYQPWELTRTDCYSQLLGNIGFGDKDKLMATVTGWRSLLSSLRPDAALLEFAPSAMVACRILGIPYALQGNGFFCPPPEREGFGIMQKRMPESDRLEEDRALLETVNAVLAEYEGEKLDHISELYAASRDMILSSFRELDHFSRPTSVPFHGVWVPDQPGRAVWPEGGGKKVFAYLSARPGVDGVLNMLAKSGLPTLLFCAGLEPKFQKPFESKSCRFLDGLVDMKALAAEADLGVFHGNHSSTALFMLSGKPSLQIPLYMEQLLFARRVKEQGAGELATLDQQQRIAQSLNQLISAKEYRNGAEEFAARYADFDRDEAIVRAADQLEGALL